MSALWITKTGQKEWHHKLVSEIELTLFPHVDPPPAPKKHLSRHQLQLINYCSPSNAYGPYIIYHSPRCFPDATAVYYHYISIFCAVRTTSSTRSSTMRPCSSVRTLVTHIQPSSSSLWTINMSPFRKLKSQDGHKEKRIILWHHGKAL